MPAFVSLSTLSGSPRDAANYLAWHRRSAKDGVVSGSLPAPLIGALFLGEVLAHVRPLEVYTADVGGDAAESGFGYRLAPL